MTFVLYISIFTEPIRVLINFTEQFQSGYTGFERFQEIMNIEPEIQDKEGAKELKEVKGDITFEDVSFGYKDAKEKVLNHVNLNVKAGSYMALVGSSGAGKTTLCSLIPRFYRGQLRQCENRRHRYPECNDKKSARSHRHCTAGHLSFCRNYLRKYFVRTPGCDAGRSDRGSEKCQCTQSLY